MSSNKIEIDTMSDKFINIDNGNSFQVPLHSIEIEQLNKFDTKSDLDGGMMDFEYLANKNKIKDLDPNQSYTNVDDKVKYDIDQDLKSANTNKIEEPLRPFTPLNTPPPPPLQPFNDYGGVGTSFFNSNLFESARTQTMTDDEIRKEKSFLIRQYEQKNANSTYSPKNLSMTNTLDEIKNELEYVNSKKSMENNLSVWKQGMIFVLGSMVQANNSYNVVDVDLSEWMRNMHYNVWRKGNYDELLEEIIVKYRGKIPVPPELKLAGLLAMSLGDHITTKKQEQREKLKREQDERLMEKKVEQHVQAQMDKMYQQFSQNNRASSVNGNGNSNVGSNSGRVGNSTTKRNSPVLAPQVAETEFNGPSLSNDDILKLVEQDFMDSTIAEDELSIVGDSVPSGSSDVKKKNEKEKKARGRPKKQKIIEINTAEFINHD